MGSRDEHKQRLGGSRALPYYFPRHALGDKLTRKRGFGQPVSQSRGCAHAMAGCGRQKGATEAGGRLTSGDHQSRTREGLRAAAARARHAKRSSRHGSTLSRSGRRESHHPGHSEQATGPTLLTRGGGNPRAENSPPGPAGNGEGEGFASATVAERDDAGGQQRYRGWRSVDIARQKSAR